MQVPASPCKMCDENKELYEGRITLFCKIFLLEGGLDKVVSEDWLN